MVQARNAWPHAGPTARDDRFSALSPERPAPAYASLVLVAVKGPSLRRISYIIIRMNLRFAKDVLQITLSSQPCQLQIVFLLSAVVLLE